MSCTYVNIHAPTSHLVTLAEVSESDIVISTPARARQKSLAML